MIHNRLRDALSILRPNSGYTLIESDLSKLTWKDPSVVTPTEAEIQEILDEFDREEITDKIAAKRYEKEVEGVSHGGIRWVGDNAGRQAVLEAIDAAERYEAVYGAGTWSTDWKGVAIPPSTERWLDGCTLDDLLTVQVLGAQRRSACFNRERELVKSVEAGTFTEDDLTIGWPE